MIISALCFTVLNSLLRYVNHLPTFELVFFRAFGTVIICLLILLKSRIPIWGNNKPLLLARAFFGLSSMAIFFYCLKLMPVGTAVSLRYLSPIFASIFALILLKEKVKKIQWLYFTIAFIGVMVLKGVDSRISLTALLLIMCCAMLSGMVYVCIRKIGITEHPVVVVFYFLFSSMIIGGFISIFNWYQPQGIEWIILLSMGVFGFYAQYFMTKAIQIELASKVVPYKYAEAIFTIIAGWLIFGETQSLIALLAICVIIFALLANTRVKVEQ